MVVNIYKDSFDVYIERRGKGHDGYFGNPVAVGQPCPVCGKTHQKGETLRCYERHLRVRVVVEPEFRARLLALKGQTLGCFCAPAGGFRPGDPEICHGQVIERWLSER